MYGWVIDTVTAFVHSPWLGVLVGVMLVCGAVLPGFPGGTTVLAASAAAAPDVPAVATVVGAAVAGSVLGDVIGHTVGRRYGTRLLAHRLLRRTRRPVLRARTFMRRRRVPVLVAGRFVPGGRLSTVLASGISRVRLPAMLVVTIPVAIVWALWMTALGVLGSAVAGHHVLGGPAAAMVISAGLTGVVVVTASMVTWLRARRRSRLGTPTTAVPRRSQDALSLTLE